ncbi:MAG: glycosyltransferase family 87 protein [Vicinamibacterales bacterium]
MTTDIASTHEVPGEGRGPRLLAHPLTQVLCGALIGALVPYYSILFGIASREHGNDFGKFYYATRAWLAGGSLYQSTIATRMQVDGRWMDFLDLNPPHFHLALLPFVWLPLNAAALAWHAANIIAAVLTIHLVLAELRLAWRPAMLLPAIVVALLASATGAIALTGQFTGMLMLPLTLAWRSARAGHWSACGAWLGAIIAIKPFLGLLALPLVLRGRARLLVGLATGGGAGFAIGVAIFGWHAHVEWLGALRQVTWAWASMNGSLLGVLSRVLEPSPTFVPPIVKPALITPTWAALSLPVAAVSYLHARHSVDHAFATGVLGALLISPLGWVYYVWLAVPGCLAVWRGRFPRGAVAGVMALCVPLFAAPLWGRTGLAAISVGSAYTWATLLLWFSTLTAREPLPAASPSHSRS